MDIYGTGWDLQGSYMEGLGGERESKPKCRLTHWRNWAHKIDKNEIPGKWGRLPGPIATIPSP